MIAIANPQPERNPNELDVEHYSSDIILVRSLCRQGLLSVERMEALRDRLETVANTSADVRMRVQADKTLASMQIQMLKLLHDSHRGTGGESQVTNQQINIYLPSNGRETTALPSVNGNGRH